MPFSERKVTRDWNFFPKVFGPHRKDQIHKICSEIWTEKCIFR
jgi:hypothetical protein